MKTSWHPRAHDDLREAVLWYDSREAGLGAELTDAIDKAIDRIALFGETFAVYDPEDGIRVCPVPRFPDHVNFLVLDGRHVRILSAKHDRQHPDYGRDRR